MEVDKDIDGRISRLPYELKLCIFCQMKDMDSVRSLALAYPSCAQIYQQNRNTIFKAASPIMARACRIFKDVTGYDSLATVKLALLDVCYEGQVVNYKPASLAAYLADDAELPPGVLREFLERKMPGFEMRIVEVNEMAQLCKCLDIINIGKKRDAPVSDQCRSVLTQVLRNPEPYAHPKEWEDFPPDLDDINVVLAMDVMAILVAGHGTAESRRSRVAKMRGFDFLCVFGDETAVKIADFKRGCQKSE
jgi:hypothetical protein